MADGHQVASSSYHLLCFCLTVPTEMDWLPSWVLSASVLTAALHAERWAARGAISLPGKHSTSPPGWTSGHHPCRGHPIWPWLARAARYALLCLGRVGDAAAVDVTGWGGAKELHECVIALA